MAAAKELLREVSSELDALSGYASDTGFLGAFADEGVNKDMSNIIVINGLPSAPEGKKQKLVDFMKNKLFAQIPLVLTDEAVFMPVNAETQMTEGFAFVELSSREDADKAVRALDNIAFDKNHTLRVVKYSDFQGFRALGDVFVSPSLVHREPRPDLYSWLTDESARDQFVLRYSNTERQGGAAEMEKHETEVLWSESRGPPALDYGGEKQKAQGKLWVEGTLVTWSPQGTRLTTLHQAGAKLWSGRGFRDEGLRFPHSNVNMVLWSPDEKWICTWNGYPSNPSPERAFIVWDAITGQEAKAFRQRRVQDDSPEFMWSPDGKYLARINVDPATATELVAVYEAPHFGLLDGRSIKAPGARDLSWCPRRHNLLAWWTPERANVPTSVSIMRLPSKEYVRQRQLFSVESCVFHWHPQGDFVAVVAQKLTRGQVRRRMAETRTGGAVVVDRSQHAGFSIEIVRLKGKDASADVLEVKDFVHSFAWEPLGSRFALITGNDLHRFSVQFFGVADRGCTPLFTLEDRAVNQLHWSPRGEFILMAGIEMNGAGMEFYDVERKKTLATAAHDVATGVSWDPSGRIVATTKVQPIGGATLTRQTVGNGYMLWSFQGARLHASEKPKMFQFTWRPRPDGLLADEEVKEVARNLRKYIGRYLLQDKERESRRKLLARLRKRKTRDEFRGFVSERVQEWVENKPLRIDMGTENEEERAQIFEDVYEVALGETVVVVE